MSEISKNLEMETYTLILKHEYVDARGQKYLLEDPIVVKQAFLAYYHWKPSVIVNEMFERMREYMLAKVK